MADVDVLIFYTGLEVKEDEAALTQLGAAVVLSWQKIPVELRRDLLRLAERVDGVPKTDQLRGRLARLIDRNKSRGPADAQRT